MKARTRSFDRQTAGGSITAYSAGVPTTTGPFPYTYYDGSCTDFIEKKKRESGLTPPSALTMMKREVKPPTLSYRMKYSFRPFPEVVMTSVPGVQTAQTGPVGSPPGGWSSIEPTDSEAIAKLLANSNPYRYTVSVPVMISELAEATSLLKFAARTFAGLFGGAYLNWRFGYMAMLEDIKTLAQITSDIEARVKELNALISKGGSRRRVFISKRKTYSSKNEYYVSNGYGAFGGTTKIQYQSKVWGSVRWRPQRDKEIEVAQLTGFNQAVKHVLDLDIPDPSTVWEMIPFSWLVDYFVNIGDVLRSIEDNDLVIPDDICIMRERTITSESTWNLKNSTGQPSRDYSGSQGGKVTVTMKNRSVHGVSDYSELLHFGFITKSQALAILGLIAANRR